MGDVVFQNLSSQLFPSGSGETPVIWLSVLKLNRRAGKKPKERIICVALRKADTKLRFLKIKQSEGQFEVQQEWNLRKLVKIDGGDKDKENEFILYFDRDKPQHLAAPDQDAKNLFLWRLLKLCMEYFQQTPELSRINIVELRLMAEAQSFGADQSSPSNSLFSDLALAGGGADGMLPLDPALGDQGRVFDTKDLITPEEQKALQDLLDKPDFNILEVRKMAENLEKELAVIETTNIRSILEFQLQQYVGVLEKLDAVTMEIEETESWLDGFASKMTYVKAQLEQIEEDNNLMEIKTKNHNKLSEELRGLLKKIDFPDSYKDALLNDNYESPQGLENILEASRALEKCIDAEMPNGLHQMAAVSERLRLFQMLRLKSVKRLMGYLQRKCTFFTDKLLVDKSRYSRRDRLVLDPHSDVWDHMLQYLDLMKGAKATDFTEYLSLRQRYVEAMQPIYRKEIHDYFSELKVRIKREKDHFLLGTAARSADIMRHDPTAGISSSSTMDSISGGGGGDLVIHQAFSDALRIYTDILSEEQSFCSQFFDLDTMSEKTGHFRELVDMLEGMTSSGVSELCALAEWAEKRCDRFAVLVMLSEVKRMNAMHESTSVYIPMALKHVHTKLEEIFERLVTDQTRSIEDLKLAVKGCGVLSHFIKFPRLIDRMESLLLFCDEDRSMADTAYSKIVTTMFECLESLAKTDPKYSDIVRLTNYRHFVRTVSPRNVPVLEPFVQQAMENFELRLAKYLDFTCAYRFDDFFKFLKGVEELLNTMTPQEVSFQMNFSKQKLRQLKSSVSSVEKGVDALLKRMDKHLGSQENLLPEVWERLKFHFTKRYDDFMVIVGKCYGETFSPTAEEVRQIFDKVERANEATLVRTSRPGKRSS